MIFLCFAVFPVLNDPIWMALTLESLRIFGSKASPQ